MEVIGLRVHVFIGLIALPSFSQVVINEMQPVPAVGEPEWVELYNPGDTEVILTNLYLYDRTSRVSLANVRIPPRSFAVLTRDTDDLKLLRRIPPIAQLYQLSLPTLNNTTENLFVATRDTIVVDSLYYDMRWGVRGRTLERIDASLPGYYRDNIAICLAPDSATCGYDNSVSLIGRDLWMRSVSLDSNAQVILTLANRGRTSLQDVPLTLRMRRPSSELWKELGTVSSPMLPPAATTTLIIPLSIFPNSSALGFGPYLLEAVAVIDDDRKWNDTTNASVYFPFPPHGFAINEIMYEPDENGGEYIEITNLLPDTIIVSDLRIGDTYPPITTLPLLWLEPGGFVTVALDTNVFRQFPELSTSSRCIVLKTSWKLNNSGETIYLTNPNGTYIDSVAYHPSWHFWGLRTTRGRSLEKIRPDLPSNEQRSWSSSTAERGGTPGALNSFQLYPEEQELLTASPNPFSPHSNDFKLQQTVMTYRLPWRSARVSVRVFDAAGIQIRELANGLYSGSHGTLLWDGRNDAGYVVGTGAYVVFLEAFDTVSTQSITSHLVVVIGK